MVFRWKEVKFIQDGIDQFFGPQPPDCHTIKNSGKRRIFSKSHKNAVIRVFWHAEFISALKTELNPTGFEKNAKNKIRYLITIVFIFFVIFYKSYQQNCIKTMESWILDGKKSNSAKMVLINFLAHSLQIVKNSGKTRFFLQNP